MCTKSFPTKFEWLEEKYDNKTIPTRSTILDYPCVGEAIVHIVRWCCTKACSNRNSILRKLYRSLKNFISATLQSCF